MAADYPSHPIPCLHTHYKTVPENCWNVVIVMWFNLQATRHSTTFALQGSKTVFFKRFYYKLAPGLQHNYKYVSPSACASKFIGLWHSPVVKQLLILYPGNILGTSIEWKTRFDWLWPRFGRLLRSAHMQLNVTAYITPCMPYSRCVFRGIKWWPQVAC